jgi:uncharacterized membrane protein
MIMTNRSNSPKDFLTKEEKLSIEEAVRKAELITSAEIRVVFARKLGEKPLEDAKKWFMRLGMEKTREANAVLICMGVASKRFAIVGDTGIDKYMTNDGWQRVRDEMVEFFESDNFAGGIAHGVSEVGKVLREHFPPREDDINELSDEVIVE